MAVKGERMMMIGWLELVKMRRGGGDLLACNIERIGNRSLTAVSNDIVGVA